MKNIKIVLTPEVEVIDVRCDKCGAVDIFHDGDANVSEFKAGFGWGSAHDQETIEFHLCDECLFSILDYEKVRYRLSGIPELDMGDTNDFEDKEGNE